MHCQQRTIGMAWEAGIVTADSVSLSGLQVIAVAFTGARVETVQSVTRTYPQVTGSVFINAQDKWITERLTVGCNMPVHPE